jgi:hypothetical protein
MTDNMYMTREQYSFACLCKFDHIFEVDKIHLLLLLQTGIDTGILLTGRLQPFNQSHFISLYYIYLSSQIDGKRL